MSYHETDQEQVEKIKHWWRSYGKYLALAVLVGLAIGFGYRYWQNQKIQTAAKASVAYDNMLSVVLNEKAQSIDDYAATIRKYYPRTPYAALASLLAAKDAVEHNKLSTAYGDLNWVIKHSTVVELQEIARLRTARLLIAENQAKKALATLATVHKKSFLPIANELRGDAYVALKQLDKASAAYATAKRQYTDAGIQDPLVQLKLAGL